MLMMYIQECHDGKEMKRPESYRNADNSPKTACIPHEQYHEQCDMNRYIPDKLCGITYHNCDEQSDLLRFDQISTNWPT